MTALGAVTTSSPGAGCEFGLCRRPAELELDLSRRTTPLRVCGLHVTPVLTWGLPEPIEPPAVRIVRVAPAA